MTLFDFLTSITSNLQVSWLLCAGLALVGIVITLTLDGKIKHLRELLVMKEAYYRDTISTLEKRNQWNQRFYRYQIDQLRARIETYRENYYLSTAPEKVLCENKTVIAYVDRGESHDLSPKL